MSINKLKREKGATGIDIATGAIIFVIFTSTVFTLYMQIYKQSALIKIHEDAMGYIIEICEDIDMQNYASTENLDIYKEQITQKINFPNDRYTLTLSKEKYTDVNEQAQDLVKKINISIKYNFAEKEREIQINKIKVKE